MKNLKIYFTILLFSMVNSTLHANPMQLYIKLHNTGNKLTIDCDDTDTIQSLMEKIHEQWRDIFVGQMRLIYAGKQLETGTAIQDVGEYGIPKQSTLHLVLRRLNLATNIYFPDGTSKEIMHQEGTTVKEIKDNIQYNYYPKENLSFIQLEANGKALKDNMRIIDCPSNQTISLKIEAPNTNKSHGKATSPSLTSDDTLDSSSKKNANDENTKVLFSRLNPKSWPLDLQIFAIGTVIVAIIGTTIYIFTPKPKKKESDDENNKKAKKGNSKKKRPLPRTTLAF